MTKIYVLEVNLVPYHLPGMPRSMIVSAFKTETEALELLDGWISGETEAYDMGFGVIANTFDAINSTISVIEVEDPDVEMLVISAQAKAGKVELTDWYQRNR